MPAQAHEGAADKNADPRFCGPLPTAPMPESPLLQHPRNRFMAFSAVGVLMVCLPLWQVLQYQQSTLKLLEAQRALLDPVSQAVNVQFGLLAHRQVSGQLLRGQPQLEPARVAVQVGVDAQLQTLHGELRQGLWSSALAEARDLSRDWGELVQGVKSQTLTATQSDHAHTLRIEQALQVLDLVTAAETVTGATDSANTDSTNTASLPPGPGVNLAEAARLLGRLAAELPPRLDAAGPLQQPLDPEWAHLQSRLLQRLSALQAALGAGAHRADASSPLGRPLAAVALSTLQLLQVPAMSGASPAERHHRYDLAVQQAYKAQWALFKEALGQQQRLLTQKQNTLQQQQAALLAALALLSAAALALAAGLLRPLQTAPQPEEPQPYGTDDGLSPSAQARAATSRWARGSTGESLFGPAPATTRGPTQPKVEAGLLMDRLRTEKGVPGAEGPVSEEDPANTSAAADSVDKVETVAGAPGEPLPPGRT